MKPIKLVFTGLNSYRSRQIVDFEKLGEGGLFGIFGPTGSGKSSILDGITLALFGGVDRATNNTRGIINQLEKALEVSFEFELGGSRYQVERRYERNAKDPDSAAAKTARLRKLGPDAETVIASRPQEVTASVEKLLGISREEFARAVVLPQGKFDQFLRLTGGDRAAMLEHLFNLKQFGEELVEKLKGVSLICMQQLIGIEREEQGLGDCSEEAIAQALLDLQTKSADMDTAKVGFDNTDKTYQDALVLRDLDRKKKTAEGKKSRLDQQQKAMEAIVARLAAAERVEPLRDLIDRQKESADKIATQSRELESKAKLRNEAAAKHQEAKNALEQAEKENDERMPELLNKKAGLRQAAEKAQKLNELSQKAGQKRHDLEKQTIGVLQIDKDISDCQNGMEQARLALSSYGEQRLKLAAGPQEKEAVERALEVLVRLEEQERMLKGASGEFKRRKEHTDNKWAETIVIVHELIPGGTIAFMDDLEALAGFQAAAAESGLKQAEEAQRQALILNSAVELAKELNENEPCPVCGAREHPRPAVNLTGEAANLKTAVQEAERRLGEVRDWAKRLLRVWHDWSNNDPHTQEARAEMEKAEANITSINDEFEKVPGQYAREDLRPRKKEITEADRQLQELDKQRDEWQKKQEALQDQLRDFNQRAQAAKGSEAAARQELTGLLGQMEELGQELNKATGGADLGLLIQEADDSINALRQTLENIKNNATKAREAADQLNSAMTSLQSALKTNEDTLNGIRDRLTAGLQAAGFGSIEQAKAAIITSADKQAMRTGLEEHQKALAIVISELKQLDKEIGGRIFDETWFTQVEARRQELLAVLEEVKAHVTLAKGKVGVLKGQHDRWQELERQRVAFEKRRSLADDLGGLLRGRRFVSFLAQEHLKDMALEASYQLGRLTGQRYALELAKDKDCEFVIRDDYNGGNRRMVSSLSGGEVFLTSLALALALSSKIQLRGKYPLGFFFLDEGFGSLDEEKLDKVMNALEKLHDRNRMVGVISHVKELRERLPRYLEVVAAGEDGGGSEIRAV